MATERQRETALALVLVMLAVVRTVQWPSWTSADVRRLPFTV